MSETIYTEKKCSKCKKIKKINNFFVDNSKKSGFTSHCKLCKSIYTKNNKDNIDLYREKNKERIRITRKKYYNKNKLKISNNSKLYYIDNLNTIRIKQNKYNVIYSKTHKEKRSFLSAKRRALKLKATPLWFEVKLVKDKYKYASKCGLHVDHIIPLNNKLVCGLHCNDNLQLLTPKENLEKSNKFII